MSEAEYRRYVRRSSASNFVFNFFINAALAWWLLRGNPELEVWGSAAYGPDLLVTGFLLSALVAAIVMEIHRRKAIAGAMNAVSLDSRLLRATAMKNRWVTCFQAGALGMLASAVLLAGVALVTPALSVEVYAVLKGLWAGALAAAIVAPATALGLHLGAPPREAA